MLVASLSADNFRSLKNVEMPVAARVTAIIGPNGAGKTNLIEALYFGLTGKSFRTADRRDLIPFGDSYARVKVKVDSEPGISHEFFSSTSRSDGARFAMDGAPIDRVAAAGFRPMISVFSPDRLEIVKGPPATRRAHLDAFIAARWPSRSGARTKFGRALAQRNALLTRIQKGMSSTSELAPWDQQVAESGAELGQTRARAVEELAEPFRSSSAEIGLEGEVGLEYRAGAVLDAAGLEAGLAERLDNDVRHGRTTWGPHHDEIRIDFNGRQLRRFGSQGQQRLGLLALFFAERQALIDGGAPIPMMLLDDVMSELDAGRRERLVARLAEGGQTLITAAESDLVPDTHGIEAVLMEDLLAGAGGEGQ